MRTMSSLNPSPTASNDNPSPASVPSPTARAPPLPRHEDAAEESGEEGSHKDTPLWEDGDADAPPLEKIVRDEGPTPPPSFSTAEMDIAIKSAARAVEGIGKEASMGCPNEAGMGGLDNYPSVPNQKPPSEREGAGAPIQGSDARHTAERTVPSRSRRVSSIADLDVLVPDWSFPAAASSPEDAEVIKGIEDPSPPDHADAVHSNSPEKISGKKSEVVAGDAPMPFNSTVFENRSLVDKLAPAGAHDERKRPEAVASHAPVPFDSTGFEDRSLMDKVAPVGAHDEPKRPEVVAEDAPGPFNSAKFEDSPLIAKLAAAAAHDKQSASTGLAPPVLHDPEDGVDSKPAGHEAWPGPPDEDSVVLPMREEADAKYEVTVTRPRAGNTYVRDVVPRGPSRPDLPPGDRRRGEPSLPAAAMPTVRPPPPSMLPRPPSVPREPSLALIEATRIEIPVGILIPTNEEREQLSEDGDLSSNSGDQSSDDGWATKKKIFAALLLIISVMAVALGLSFRSGDNNKEPAPPSSDSWDPNEMLTLLAALPSALPSLAPSPPPSELPSAPPSAPPSLLPSTLPSNSAVPSAHPSRAHDQVLMTGSPDDITPGGRTAPSYGFVFNIRTKKDAGVVLLEGFNFYTRSTEEVNFEMWTRLGSWKGHRGKYDGWDLVGSGTVRGRGVGRYTAIPEGMLTPMSIPGGGGDAGTRAFYFTLDTNDLLHKWGDFLQNYRSYAETPDIEVWAGDAVLSYPFPDPEDWMFYHSPRQYLGAIFYNRLPELVPSTPPSELPSAPPSGSSVPSTLPSELPSAPPSGSSVPSTLPSDLPSAPPSGSSMPSMSPSETYSPTCQTGFGDDPEMYFWGAYDSAGWSLPGDVATPQATGKLVADVSTGSKYSIVILPDGTAQTAGFIESLWDYSGYLGLKEDDIMQGGNFFQNISHAFDAENELIIDAPFFVKAYAGVEQLSSPGSAHSLLIDDGGNAWATGSNSRGQLCLGDFYDRLIPQQIQTPGPVVRAAIGSEHSLLLLDDGSVYGCGSNVVGQLGLGDGVKEVKSPTQIGGLGAVESLSAGLGHSLFKSSDVLYVAGDNQYGQLCESQSITGVNVMTPTMLTDVNAREVVTFEAIRTSSFVLFKDGSVGACGRNNFGQLGDGTEEDKDWVEIDPLPGNVAIRRLGVGPSSESVFFVNDIGAVYATGRNDRGQLGVGDRLNRKYLMEVDFGNPVQAAKVSASGEHTLIKLVI